MLGNKRCDLRLSNDAVVESEDLRVRVDDGGGDAVQSAVFEVLDLVSEKELSHGHLLEFAFEGRM